MDKLGRVLLLPHPGKQRFPDDGSICRWPRSNSGHARKFLRLHGQWSDIYGSIGKDQLEMWTEYEAPTITGRLDELPQGPKYVHEIISEVGPPTYNTDPWIFHPGFVWTTCRHTKAGDARSGDIVLFGSVVGGNWVLDTVFVIGDRLQNMTEATFGPIFQVLVTPVIKHPSQPFIGRSFQHIDTPFSFVPCARAGDGHSPFPRPRINGLFKTLRKMDGSIPSVANAQALTFTAPVKGIDALWGNLLAIIKRHNLVMGIEFKHPGITVSAIPQNNLCHPKKHKMLSDNLCRGSLR